MTMIQALSQTIGINRETIIVLDALRKQRNVADYSGDIVPDGAVNECIAYAEKLLLDVHDWMRENKPDLVA